MSLIPKEIEEHYLQRRSPSGYRASEVNPSGFGRKRFSLEVFHWHRWPSDRPAIPHKLAR